MDPSGAVVIGADVQLHARRLILHQKTDSKGQYHFQVSAKQSYRLQVFSNGFSVANITPIRVSENRVLDVHLSIAPVESSVDVSGRNKGVGIDEAQNASTIVLNQERLEAFSDDPDKLSAQLQEFTRSGTQVIVDGFRNLPVPPKNEIEEVRIVSDSYPPEAFYPGGDAIEITTKGGTDKLRGSGTFSYNNQSFDSRNPFFTGSELPPYSNQAMYFNFSGPILKNKMWWTFNYARRLQDRANLINAMTLDGSFNEVPVNESVTSPRLRPTIEPRFDWQIRPDNLLSVVYVHGTDDTTNLGVGNYSLPSHAYSFQFHYNEVRASDSAQLSANILTSNQVLVQQSWIRTQDNVSATGILVPGAFDGGGAQMGPSSEQLTWAQINSITSWSKGHHLFKWGASTDLNWYQTQSQIGFGGTYTFQGGTGPELSSSLQAIPDTSVELTALDVYQRTLQLQSAGVSPSAIRALGGGAYQFSLNAGNPDVNMVTGELGVFVGDQWRLKPDLNFSYGGRFEFQSNIPVGGSWAPRIGLAWAPARLGGKTVIRTGMGAFYDHIPSDTVLNSLRYNGTTQQSYLVTNPDFFPALPSSQQLASSQSPQQIQLLDPHLQRNQLWQASVAIEREINEHLNLSLSYVEQRGVHIALARNINAPLPDTYTGPGTGTYPYGDTLVRMSTESTGVSRTHELTFTPSFTNKYLMLGGSYRLTYGKTDTEDGLQPSDSYDLRLDWGPSSFDDVRHRIRLFATASLPLGLKVGTFFGITSPYTYNITTGIDSNGDSAVTERPGLLRNISAASCTGINQTYRPPFGCFDLDPDPSQQIQRNFGRGLWQFNLESLSVDRSWKLRATPTSSAAGPHDHAFSPTVGVGVEADNPFNHTVLSTPDGDLSSPYFGQYRSSVSGRGAWGRQITLKARFSF
jgi:hypothetical protein